MDSISASGLRRWLSADDTTVTLLDIREQWEHVLARIPGALHIPMDQLPGRMHELAQDAKVVVMCHHGVRSEQVCRFLEQAGFAQVYNLAGGIHAWSREVDPDVAVY